MTKPENNKLDEKVTLFTGAGKFLVRKEHLGDSVLLVHMDNKERKLLKIVDGKFEIANKNELAVASYEGICEGMFKITIFNEPI